VTRSFAFAQFLHVFFRVALSSGFDMTCIKQLAQLEPLVDCCDPEQVMTDSAQLLEIDLYTTTKEQLDFQSKFEIKASRTDYAHALVCYFNVEFSKTHNKLKMSTGPKSKCQQPHMTGEAAMQHGLSDDSKF
jgi:hypothetical protein